MPQQRFTDNTFIQRKYLDIFNNKNDFIKLYNDMLRLANHLGVEMRVVAQVRDTLTGEFVESNRIFNQIGNSVFLNEQHIEEFLTNSDGWSVLIATPDSVTNVCALKAFMFVFDFRFLTTATQKRQWIWSFEYWRFRREADNSYEAGEYDQSYTVRGAWVDESHPWAENDPTLWIGDNPTFWYGLPGYNQNGLLTKYAEYLEYLDCFSGFPETFGGVGNTSNFLGYNMVLTPYGATMTTPVFDDNGGGTNLFTGQYYWFASLLTNNAHEEELALAIIANNTSDYDTVAIRGQTIYSTLREDAAATYPFANRQRYFILNLVPLLDKISGYFFPHLFKKVFGAYQECGYIELDLVGSDTTEKMKVFGGEHLCLRDTVENGGENNGNI